MKATKRQLHLLKASNVSLDLETMEAFSYGWWLFLIRLPSGQLVFNSYNYSRSTIKHQWKVRSELRSRGYTWIEVDVAEGLQVYNWQDLAWANALDGYSTAFKALGRARKKDVAMAKVFAAQDRCSELAKVLGKEWGHAQRKAG